MRGDAILNRGKRVSVLILLILLSAASSTSGAEGPWKFCPLPVVETVRVLSWRLMEEGFSVRQVPTEEGGVRLIGLKGNETWQIVVEFRSPLASRVFGEYTFQGRPERNRVEQLWTDLDRYLSAGSPEGNRARDETPGAVLSQGNTVVCLRARKGHDVVQFTGFIIDRKGLILSTAHDLSGVGDLTATLDRGEVVQGRLVKIDFLRDLTLIELARSVDSFVALAGARDLDRTGERVYSVTCSDTQERQFRAGITDGPLRRSGGQSLLQVQMETLPGSSGSPVFDKEGNLIGLIKGRYRGTDSTGFLIPPQTLKEFAEGR
jgi:serine protease Do